MGRLSIFKMNVYVMTLCGWLQARLAWPTAESWLRTEEDASSEYEAGVSLCSRRKVLST